MRTALAALALCAACTPRALSVPEEGADLAVARDASIAPVDAAVCGNQHKRTPVAILQIVPIDGQPRFTYGAAARVLVSFPYREGCDEPGDIEVGLNPGGATTFVTLIAHDWLGTTGCGGTTIETRELTLSNVEIGGNPRIVIQDGFGMNGAALELGAEIGPLPACVPQAVGSACRVDCDCGGDEPRARCLPGSDGISRCGVPCHSDTQCRGTSAATCIGEPMYACGQSNRCRLESECQAVEQLDRCLCTRPHAQPAGLCGCDAECPSGALCTSEGYCARICTGDRTCADFDCTGEGCEFCSQGMCVQLID